MQRRHEKPIRRVNPSGAVRWVARYTDRHGKVRSAGTFDLRREAQAAIDGAYEQDSAAPATSGTVGDYAATWIERHPRSARTNTNYNHRLGRVLDIELDRRVFRDWPMVAVRRRQVNDLVDHLLRVQGRAQKGAVGVLRVLSAMWQDAIGDECVDANPFMGVKVKASDPRIRKAPRVIHVWSWEEMHRFAAVAATVRTGQGGPSLMDRWRATYAEAMVRVLSDCGLRLGELLALQRADFHDGMLEVRRTAWGGRVTAGTKTDHGEVEAGRLAPVPPALAVLLDALPARIDTRLLFPTPTGRLWQETPFYRDLWRPAQEATGLAMTPHELRHSWVSYMRAARIDPADLADAGGHTVETATKHYTHALGRSFDAMRRVVDEASSQDRRIGPELPGG